MHLSPHFTLEELTKTDAAGLQTANRLQALNCLPSLTRVAENLLEPIRVMFCAPIIVNSGYRCEAVNRAVGGSPYSQHRFGEAVDFNISGWEDRRQEALGKIHASGLQFHQLLIELGCLHISLPIAGRPNGEIAYWEAGEKTIIKAAV